MTDSAQPDPFDLLVRLDRVATGLEGEGYFGAAKLCRAAQRSLLARAAYDAGIPRANSGLLAEFDRLLTDLQGVGISAPALAALEVGRAAAHENRPTAWTEISAVHVCRLCGELFYPDVPETCPTCGSHALTFWDVPSMFYLEPLTPQAALDALGSMAETLSEAIGGLSETQMTTVPAAGEWSVRDVVWHLLMAQSVLHGRAEKLLAEPNPDLAAAAVWTMTSDGATTTHDILAQFDRSRRETVALLRDIPYDSWLRSGYHTEFGPVTLLQQATYFAKHERYHLPQIHEIRRVVSQ